MFTIRCFGLLAAAVLTVSAQAQDVELGPAPRVDFDALKSGDQVRTFSPAAAGGWLDTSNRTAVATSWASSIANSENVVMSWTGTVSPCVAGDVSTTWRNAVLARVKWYRGMAGVPDGVVYDTTWNSGNQQAALMMSANQALNHEPPASWACYTAAGKEAAGRSNICYLSNFGNVDPGCVSGYMRDDGASNLYVGHRRWILYPQSTRIGTGDVSQTGSFGRANAMWVVDSVALAAARPATRESFVAWPPKGYVPYQTVFKRWSFAYPGAIFTNAAVTMSRNGSAISSAILAGQTGFGENTLVWEPSVTLGVAGADTPVDVTVSNVVIGGVAQTFSYRVIVFDPLTVAGTSPTVSVTINSSPSARAVTVDGSNFQTPHTFQWTTGSSHTLAVPSPQTVSDLERSVFTGWNFSGTNTQTVSPSVNSTYTINFRTEYKLNTRALPANSGTVSATPSSASGFYTSGDKVVLNASAIPPYTFTNWSDDSSGTSAQLEITMDRGKTATAIFASSGSGGGGGGTTTGGAGLHFVPLAPCRVIDTRNANGDFGGPILRGNASRSILIPGSPCGVPASARAYSLNITVVPSGPLGYLTIWPTGQTQPLVSTLNAPDGQITANAAIVPAGSSGGVNVFVTNDTHLVMDINGYFDLPKTGASGFFPVTPCRVTDTRNPNGSLGGPVLAAGAVRSIPVPTSLCGIPPGATGYVLNLTVVPQGALGYISTWPTGQAQPLVSTTNAPSGQVTANMAIVPAGTSGAISFFAPNSTHFVLDITGYFAAPELPGSLKLYPVSPCRLVDTRNPNGPLGGPAISGGGQRSFPFTQSGCGIPPNAQAYSANFTVVPQGPLGYLTTWPTGLGQPLVSTLNATDGQVTANAAIVPAGAGGAVSVFVTNGAHAVIDTNGYFAQ